METCQHCGTVLPTADGGGRYCPNCGAMAGAPAGPAAAAAAGVTAVSPAEHPYEAFFRPAPGEPSPHTRTQVMPVIPAQAQGYHPDQPPAAQPAYDQPIDYQAGTNRPFSEPYDGPYTDDYAGDRERGHDDQPKSGRAAMIGIGVAAAAILVIIVSLITLGGGKAAPAPQAGNTRPTEVLTPAPHTGDSSSPAAPGTAPSDPATPAVHVPGTLRLGDSGAEVKWLQNRLKQLNLYNGDISGTFDQATAAAVTAFQNKAHTAASDQPGVVGRSTKTALIAWGSRPRFTVFGAGDQGPRKHAPNPEDVKRLQRALSVALGQEVKASGTYDMATVGAVMQYQAAVGLVPDGATGDRVWAALQQGKLP